MRRKSFDTATCPVARSLDVIGDWWSLLIIRDAIYGIRRFGEFQRSLGLATNILSTRLKGMLAQGIMEVVPASDGSAYQEYALTAKGRALLPVVVSLSQWGADYLFEAGETQAAPVDALAGKPLERMTVRARDGRTLQPEDLAVGSIRTPSARGR